MIDHQKNNENFEDKPDDDGFAALKDLDIPGKRVTIRRLEPKWAEGFLETRSIDDTFGLEYLISEWGGQLHRLTIRDSKGRFVKQFDVPLRSYYVKIRGKEVNEDDIRRGSRTDQPSPKQEDSSQLLDLLRATQSTQQTPMSDLSGLEKVLSLFQNSKHSELQLLGSLLPQLTKPQPQSSPYGQVIEFAQAMQAMQGVFGNIGQVPSPEPDFLSGLPSLIGELIKIKSQKPSPSLPVSKPILPKPNHTQLNTTPKKDLVMELASQNPDEIVSTLSGLFENLPDNKRQDVIDGFLGQLDPEDLDGLFDDDTSDDYSDNEKNDEKK